MSEYVQVAAEIAQLDALLNQQYLIELITENLDGAQVVLGFENHQTEMNITTAEARKYLTVKLQEQLNKQPQK
ncbi:hypothetical protein ACIQ4I_00695 [Rummeliibacillus sp. NPDC094406]|uniref:hypothetical protein n=1 Tax=Rummeliibacillus sp. NPDC094406 TaxID=3364511 RepID=UPI00381B6AF4